MDLNESSLLCHKRQNEPPSKIIRVPMATFPPTAIVYSVSQVTDRTDSANDSDIVIPAAVLAHVLTKPDTAFYQSGRVVVCRHCLSENSVGDSWTQTESRVLSEMSSSGPEGNSAAERCLLCPAHRQEERPHPKVHCHRYNSVESQNQSPEFYVSFCIDLKSNSPNVFEPNAVNCDAGVTGFYFDVTLKLCNCGMNIILEC